jgi:hypothetical protein
MGGFITPSIYMFPWKTFYVEYEENYDGLRTPEN